MQVIINSKAMKLYNRSILWVGMLLIMMAVSCSKTYDYTEDTTPIYSAEIVGPSGLVFQWLATQILTEYDPDSHIITLTGTSEDGTTVVIRMPESEGSFSFAAKPIDSNAAINFPLTSKVILSGVEFVQNNAINVNVETIKVSERRISGSFFFKGLDINTDNQLEVRNGQVLNIAY